MTGSHANRLGRPTFEPAPPAVTVPDVMTAPEAALVYRAGPPLPAPVEPDDPVMALLQRLAGMRGFNDQVRRALAWLVMNADDLPVPYAEDEPDERAAKNQARAAVCAHALGYLRPAARAQEPPRPRRRSGRGGRGRKHRAEPEHAAAG